MKFENIINNKEIRSNLKWSSPEQYFQSVQIKSEEQLKAYEVRLKELSGYYFIVSVWNLQARLALMHIQENGDSRVEHVEFEDNIANSIENLLEDAVKCTGSALNRSGFYPLSSTLTEYLKDKLMRE